MRRRALMLVSLSALVLPAVGATQDLLSVYKTARQSDPVFQQAQADLKAVEEAVPQARAGLLPDVRASANYDRVDREQTTRNNTQSINDNSYAYGVRLTQPVFRYDRIQQLDQAEARVASAQAELAAARQDLFLRVAERYFATLDAREALAAAQAEKRAVQRQLDQAQERYEVGVIARTDVEEAQSRFDLASADVIEAENEVRTARERLREITGRAAGDLEELRADIELSAPTPDDEDVWRKRAIEQNHQLAAAKKASSAAMENIDVQRGSYYPNVDIVAEYNNSDRPGSFGSETEESTIGVQVEFPLFRGGATNSEVREAQYRYTEAREQLKEQRRLVARTSSDAYRGVKTALKRVQALDQARRSTRSALEATEAGFDVGTRTIVDVLDAQRELFRAERDYQQARHAYLLNTLRLQEAAGQLAKDSLAEVNSLLVSERSEETPARLEDE